MLNEDRFHNLIEEDGQDKKQTAWQKVQAQLKEDGEALPYANTSDAQQPHGAGTGENVGGIGSKGTGAGGRYGARRYLPVFVLAAVILLVVALVITFVVLSMQKEEKITLLPSSNYDAYNVSLDGYTCEDAGYTLKDYAEKNGVDVLYFDYYEAASNPSYNYYWDYIYYDENGGIFCFEEEIFADYYYKITIFKEDSGVDFSEGAASFGVQATEVNGVQVYWSCGHMLYVKINYGGYLYFIESESYFDTAEDVQQLLSPMFH